MVIVCMYHQFLFSNHFQFMKVVHVCTDHLYEMVRDCQKFEKHWPIALQFLSSMP